MLMTCLASACSGEELPIACRLDAMAPEIRSREAALLQEHRDAYVEAREDEGGYSYRYEPDAVLFARMAELVGIEHRCCPFLTFSLEWASGEASPWLHIGGGARVKPFVAVAFGGPR